MSFLDIFQLGKTWYERYEKYNPFVFFFGGFTWDSITLKSIDQLFDNLILLAYLILLGILLSLTAFIDRGKIRNPYLLKHQEWFPLALQFFLGGLLSAYVIYYFQSASFTKTALFLCLLILLFIANEFLEKRLRNLHLLLGLYFVVTFSFFIFFIPTVTKTLNYVTFLASGIVSLAVVLTLIYFFKSHGIFPSVNSFRWAMVTVLSLYALMNLLYVRNWIPPVPLSMKTGGIYHHASRSASDDAFVLQFEKPKWYEILTKSDRTFHYAAGDTVSCFTAIFAPAKLTKEIVHHWQKYSQVLGKWETTDRLSYEITGFRDGGYRGITRKRNVSPGKWRVDIKTQEGVLLGRVGFEIVLADGVVPLKTIYR